MSDDAKPVALEVRGEEEARLFSPSAARNRDPIRDAFLRWRPSATGSRIIEIASGTGEHVAHLAAAAPDLFFRPGDPDAASRRSIAAWTMATRLSNIAPPHATDVCDPSWPNAFDSAAGVIAINMIHIAPFAAAEGLFSGAAQLLARGGRLYLYGPFAREGAHTAPSNEAFDRSLRARDPRWGVRDLEREIDPLAARHSFRRIGADPMPANNFFVVFEKV